MKLSVCVILALTAHSALAFAPTLTSSSTSTTALNLFGGGGGKKEGGGDKGPGMMNQLAMFKKAQEVAQKKKKLDEELQATPFVAEAADGKVKASFKYVPVMNPMDPNPDYEAIGFEFDDEYYESASAEELSAACKEAVLSGVETINNAVAEKYAVLQQDLMDALGGMQQGGAQS
eukprot:scaffold982_cov169-Amphora_coffeaeformis.AAC.14